MNPPSYQQIRMTPDEKEFMQTVYDLRLKNLWFPGLLVSLVNAVIVFFALYFFAAFILDIGVAAQKTVLNTNNIFTWLWQHKLFMILVLDVILLWLHYYFKVLPFKHDAETGMKQKISFMVTEKEYFPVTGQYFVWFLGKPKHYEIDEETYLNCREGGPIYYEQALYSKHIFCLNDHETVKLFTFGTRNNGYGYNGQS